MTVKTYIKSYKKSYIHTLYNKINNRLDADTLDLLTNLLELNPERRISAKAALAHKYFSKDHIIQIANQEE